MLSNIGLLLIVVLSLLTSLPLAHADDTSVVDSTLENDRVGNDDSHQDVVKEPAAKPVEKQSKPTVERQFDPSEEISEDLSVPFPVDI